MDKETEEKIITLETKLAYMEDFVSKLQNVCVEHTDMIEKLRMENRILSDRFKELSENLEEIPNRKPPHY